MATSEPGANVGFMSDAEVDERRARTHFRRAYDGHVALQGRRTGKLYDIKLDMQAPGTLLLRDMDGQVYYAAYASLKQVDLSDDEVVGVVAADDTLEDSMVAIQDGDTKLQLSREGFYSLVSILPPDLWGKPAEELLEPKP